MRLSFRRGPQPSLKYQPTAYIECMAVFSDDGLGLMISRASEAPYRRKQLCVLRKVPDDRERKYVIGDFKASLVV